MKNNHIKKQNYSLLSFFIPFTIMLVIFFIYHFIFGAKINGFHGDYYYQHISFYDYVRESFYITHDFFPQWNMSFGGFSSFANLVYYGSMNPFVWISFLFPGIPMSVFFELVIVFMIPTISYLNYKFMSFHGVPDKTNFIIAIIFSVFPTIITQLQTQLPFILFYPFFLICLISIQKFEKRYPLFIISMAMIYYLNFTFSFSVFIFMSIYIIYLFLEKKIIFLKINKFFIYFIFANIIAFMIGFLPFVVQVLASNARSVGTDEFVLFNFSFLNDIYISQYTAFGYNWSLFIFGCIMLIPIFYKKHRNLIIFPLFIFLTTFIIPLNKMLNMFLYYDVKVYIHMLPFVMLLVAIGIGYMQEYKNSKFWLILISSNIFIAVLLFVSPEMFIEDIILYCAIQNFSILLMYYNRNILVYCLFIIGFITISFVCFSDIRVIEKPLTNDCGTVASEFYRADMPPGVEYNITACDQDFVLSEYTSILNAEYAEYALYNMNNIDIKYAVSSTTLNDPLTEYVLSIDSDSNPMLKPFIYGVEEQYLFQSDVSNFSNIDMVTHVEVDDNTKPLHVDDVGKVIVQEEIIVEPFTETTFDISNLCTTGEYIELHYSTIGSQSYNINGADYEVVDQPFMQTSLYNCDSVSNLKVYSEELLTINNISYQVYNLDEVVNNAYPYVTPNNINIEYNEKITFDLTMLEDGMIVTTIPYDKGYTVKIDGVEVETEKVNEYFLGVPISSGEHTVEITFKMSGFYIGVIITTFGILTWLSILFIRKELH